jgi:precorrin-6A synthase
MMQLTLIGIGTGNPEHLTLQAIRAMNAADLILIPRKGAGKDDLAALRRDICAEVLTSSAPAIAEFDLPVRDPEIQDYESRVHQWHDAIAAVWAETISAHTGAINIALLVWGDPALYDSTLRIAARLRPAPQIKVIPGIMSLQALTAAFAIPLNDIGAPFLVTTGRRLRDEGWPAGIDRIIVMLDGSCAFQEFPPDGLHIWWAAYAGMAQEIRIDGPLAEVTEHILNTRAKAREDHGWLMDIYLLARA